MKLPLALLMLCFATAALGQTSAQQRWIDRLKTAQVSSLEPGMPSRDFDAWLTGILHPVQPKYEMKECEDPGGAATGAAKEKPLCVQASADLARGRTARLVFKVGSYASDGGQRTEKPARIELLSGEIGPTNPMSKQPTRLVRKLSDFEAMVK